MNRTGRVVRTGIVALALATLGGADDATSQWQVKDDGKGLILQQQGKPLLRYNYQPFGVPPQDAAPAFWFRSGNIHPIWSPSGKMLTEAYPSSHAHHLGLWNAWTKTTYRDQSYDFWNLKEPDHPTMTRSTGFSVLDDGLVATNSTFIERAEGEERVLEETLTIRARSGGIDYTLVQNWLMDDPLVLEKYRYGGPIAWRYPSRWAVESIRILTSEGHEQNGGARTGADATRARWILVSNGGYEGMAILSHPANFRHPEPLRVLHDGEGDGGYVHFTPVREEEHRLQKGRPMRFRFRLMPFDRQPEASDVEGWWMAFSGAED